MYSLSFSCSGVRVVFQIRSSLKIQAFRNHAAPRASDVDSIVELEGTTSRLVRADDLATIDVERSLCAIVNEGNVIPRISS